MGDAAGNRTTCGLIGGLLSGENYGTGRIYPDNGYDTGGQCGDWNEDCKSDECVVNAAKGYPNPSNYHLLLGPNSNTFAGTIARACNLTPPPAAGGAATPGWNHAPAPAKKGKAAEPVRCHVP